VKRTLSHLSLLAKRLGLLLLLYFICRLLFLLFNLKQFPGIDAGIIGKAFFSGLLFDMCAISIINAVFILLSLLPLKSRNNNRYRKGLKYLFFFTNGAALLFNFIDLAYFPFTHKRTTADFFTFITTGDDTLRLLPTFLLDFWYVPLLYIAAMWLMVKLYNKISSLSLTTGKESENKYYIKHGLILILATPILVFFIRGGYQLRPIGIIDAAEYVDAPYIPIVLNTPFSILKTFEPVSIEEMKYMSEEDAKKVFNPVHPAYQGEFKPKNVVIIILESFSYQYVGFYHNGKGCTPFLDSLMLKGLSFNYAFANGKRSMEAIPAVLSGLPTFMDEPFITSSYNGNKIQSVATYLKDKGYYSSFFHGAENGSMDFDNYCSLAGFDAYFGKNEYNNESDNDGNWGIWDEPFLNFYNSKLSEMKTPFVSAIFTLSSHHPYNIPDKYKEKFKEGEEPLCRSIRYTDHSLKEFFAKALKEKWFENTLFVITADHTGDSKDPLYLNDVGNYRIPLLFYAPGDSLMGNSDQIVQQSDILASILEYLNYDKPHFSFGQSVFDSTANRWAIYSPHSKMFQMNDDSMAILFNGTQTASYHNYKKDPGLKNNMALDSGKNFFESERKIKALIQLYNHIMINNKLTAE
jgi:phosphoglycerol transferase MdoB-like AlkP superfamily enzyme